MTCPRCNNPMVEAERVAYGCCEDCWAGNRQEGHGAAAWWSGGTAATDRFAVRPSKAREGVTRMTKWGE